MSVSSSRLQVALRLEELRSMLIHRGSSALKMGLSIVLALTLATTCGAAVHKKAAGKKAATAKSGRVYVPGNIMAGSSVTGKRAFYPPKLPEDVLAGIRLGRPAKEVLRKWGNPSRITVGTTQSEGPQSSASAAGIPYTPPQTESTGVNLAAQLLGRQSTAIPNDPLLGLGGSGSLPGLSAAPPAAATVQPQSQSSSEITSEEVTWTYDLQNGVTLEFIVTDGLVTQITVGGQGPWGLSKTRTGLQLGDTYKLVLWVCGYPENQRYASRFLRASYVNKSRALYTFLNKKLVGITIAMVPSELAQ